MGKGARNSFAVSSTFRFSAFIDGVGFIVSTIVNSSRWCRKWGMFFDETSLCPSLCSDRCRTFGLCVHGRRRSMAMLTNMESRGCVSLRLFLSFSKPINLDLPFHLDPCSPARCSLKYKAMPPTWCDPTTGAAFVDAARLARSSRSIERRIRMPLLGNLTSIRRESCPSIFWLKRAYPWWLSTSSSWTWHLVVPLC